jgi:aspartyl-tRNA(Asn)/glutamyl-tRNA(Gln) amidotransferase subunit A
MPMFPPIRILMQQLHQGKSRARALIEEALAHIDDPQGEGRLAFLAVNREAAIAQADFYDGERAKGRTVPAFAGIPIAVKDLFDLAGEVTRVGSKLLNGAPPAERDATAVARLKTQGFIIVGRTNMTEFAYSGVGLNPHYGTPRSPYDRATGRIPGGSSSGSAVAVADGMVPLALGTDTGGSCRIPAAYCGVTGYKPSVGRISKDGVYPLSATLDSVGPLAQTVDCCAVADAIMAGEWPGEIAAKEPRAIRLGLPTSHVRDGLEPPIVKAFDRSLSLLSKAGVRIDDFVFPELAELPVINAKGGISAVEAFAHHRRQIEAYGSEYDQRVMKRIMSGAGISAPDYVDILAKRRELIAKCDDLMAGFDALIMPTSPNVPPPITALATDEEYARLNFLSLKNTFLGNFLDRCAISLPMHAPDEPPAGLMLMAAWGRDRQLFAVAQAAETALSPVRSSDRKI